MLNLHKVLDDAQALEKYSAIKLNFYSTIKYKFSFDETKNYFHKLSASSITGILYGYNLFSRKSTLEKLITTM